MPRDMTEGPSHSEFESCIYEGVVRHRRNFPVRRQFDFRLFLFYLNVNDIESTFKDNWLVSSERISFARFLQQEHLKEFGNEPCLSKRVDLALKANGCDAKATHVMLLTQLRYFGFSMNPISIFYCFDAQGELFATISQVNNTPWGEQHLYVVQRKNAEAPNDASLATCANSIVQRNSLGQDNVNKELHVSPFMSLDMSYKMKFSRPSNRLAVKIENHLTKNHHEIDRCGAKSDRILDVTLRLSRVKLARSVLTRYLLRYPLISFKAFAGIYWQALLLFLNKKIRFYPHPDKRQPENGRELVGLKATDPSR